LQEGIIAGLNPSATVFKTNFSQLCPTNVRKRRSFMPCHFI
jgi:hypothetical protein